MQEWSFLEGREVEEEEKSNTDGAQKREKGIFLTKGEKNPLFWCTRVYEDASNKVRNPMINTSEMLILAWRRRKVDDYSLQHLK